MPVTTFCDDPFGFKVLQAEDKLSHARGAIKKEAHPMTYSLGRAVGNLVAVLGFPPKHFECGKSFRSLSPQRCSDTGILTGVWSLWQDYKYYSAEGGTRRGPWSRNAAFRDGALSGYQARSGLLATLENKKSAKEIVQIDDSSSDSDSSDPEGQTHLEVQNWVQKTQAATQSLQHFTPGTRKWLIQHEDLSNEFLAELKELAETANVDSPHIDGDKMIEDTVCVSDTNPQEEAGNMASEGIEIDTTAVIEGGLGVPSSDSDMDLGEIHKLCKDLLGMHGEANRSRMAAKEMEYNFCWTGM